MSHSGHEFVLCLRGQLEYVIDNQEYLLESGDSLLFSGSLEHKWRNPGNIVTTALILLSGFHPGESPSQYHIASVDSIATE